MNSWPAKRAILALAVFASCALPAAAQVVRCTDPATGKISYTDEACPRGDAAREIEARKSAQEIAQEREQAAEALQRKHERQQLEALQRQEAQQAEPATVRPRAGNDSAQSMQCHQARKTLQDLLHTLGRGLYDEQMRLEAAQHQVDLACLSPADYARTERSRGHQPIQPSPYYGPPVVVVPPRPVPPPQRRDIVNCNVFRCYDGKGNVYPR